MATEYLPVPTNTWLDAGVGATDPFELENTCAVEILWHWGSSPPTENRASHSFKPSEWRNRTFNLPVHLRAMSPNAFVVRTIP